MTVGRYIEDEDRDEGVADERYYQVDRVEEELATNDDVKAPHRKRFGAAGVTDAALLRRRTHDVKLYRVVQKKLHKVYGTIILQPYITESCGFQQNVLKEILYMT